ncbi:MAG TPA: hypothetical protein VJ455_12010, partial [Ignavibacteria bacterium]|nr:hypothetical protein [Ignavibacteria bacterium]
TFSQLGGHPGAFTRMGFSARGIGMGNAMTSVTSGDIMGLYNPALSPFQDDHLINLSYSFLSLDRKLNFITYTKNFKLPNQPQGGAGITFAWVNAGVTDIDGRDLDGFSIGTLSTFENEFLFAPSIRVSDKVSLGAGFKLYYSKLYEGVTTTSFGFDLGALYRVNDRINVGLTVSDINVKYKWNTIDVYGQLGNTTDEKFPILYTLGVSYLLPNNFGLVSVDYETSNKKSNIIRVGAEIYPVKDIKFRAGMDRLDMSAADVIGGTKGAFGLGYQRSFGNYIVGIDYSFVLEPYTHNPFQTITAVFKIK